VLSSGALKLILLSVMWLALIVWTLYRLGSEKARRDEFVFKYGVKQFGIAAWLAGTAIGSCASFQNRPQHPLLAYVAIYGFFLLPLALWLGFLWGKGMKLLGPYSPRK